MKRKLAILVVCVFLLPIGAWAVYKPVRVLAPELNGMNCVTNEICAEEGASIAKAKELYERAFEYVNASVGEFKTSPGVTFCTSERCYESFGFRAPATATTVGVSGIVVSPRGWNEYHLRHEMIHHLQAERLGVIGKLRSPEWFREGMAYSLSEQPRDEIPEPWRTHSYQFDDWLLQMGQERLWVEAARL